MKGKNNTLIGILILLIGISIFVAIFIFSSSKTSPEDGYFNPKKKAAAEKIYKEMTEVDIENYPQSPEEVVAYYLKGTRLLLGNMINDEKVIPEILRMQRITYDRELLDSTPLELQEVQIKNDMKTLFDKNICVVECQTLPIIFYENDISKGYVRVTLELNSGNKYYFKYYVKRDDNGFWRIEGYTNSNEKFTE